MTPFELSVYADEYVKSRQREAYLNGIVIRSMIGTLISDKRPLTYEQMFGKDGDGVKQEPMTDRKMFNNVLLLNKLFGGDFVQEGVSDSGN